MPGRSRSSPSASTCWARPSALGGDFATAALLIAEADAVTEATGTRVAPYGALVLAAFRGQEAEASELIDATIEEATAGGQGTAVQYAHWADAVVMNGLGRYEEALAAAIDGERRHARAVRRHVGAQRADRGRHAGPGTPSSRRARSRDWASRREASDADWALGIAARDRARC